METRPLCCLQYADLMESDAELGGYVPCDYLATNPDLRSYSVENHVAWDLNSHVRPGV